MIDLTEFTGIFVLMCEWYLTGKKMCVNCTFVYLFIFYENLPGLMCERG